MTARRTDATRSDRCPGREVLPRTEVEVKAKVIIGVLLVSVGVVALAYRTFSYTKKTHSAEVAGVELSFKEKGKVEIPVWAGAGAVVAGVVLLLAGRKG